MHRKYIRKIWPLRKSNLPFQIGNVKVFKNDFAFQIHHEAKVRETHLKGLILLGGIFVASCANVPHLSISRSSIKGTQEVCREKL